MQEVHAKFDPNSFKKSHLFSWIFILDGGQCPDLFFYNGGVGLLAE